MHRGRCSVSRPYAAGPWEHRSTETGEPCPTCGSRIVVTREQYDILVLTATGLTAQGIARRLGSNQAKVQNLLRKLQERYEARHAAHLVAMAVRSGLLPAVSPDCPPGRLTAGQVQVFAYLAEGLTLGEIAGVTHFDLAAVRDAKREVRELLGTDRLPALLTMLYGLGELSRRHWCRRSVCVRARQERETAFGPRVSAREAAARWAGELAAAAAWRIEHRRARGDLAETMAALQDSQLALRAARTEADEVLAAAELLLAGEVASAQARADARTADAGLAVVALQAKAALTGVERVLGAGDVVNRRLTALGKRQDELAENQKRVE
ncbi:hypothetical protein BU198_04955, partial [Streptomyces sp. CBMA156]|nr:hypothetical protein [Streptomyces sp. CBMA156]